MNCILLFSNAYYYYYYYYLFSRYLGLSESCCIASMCHVWAPQLLPEPQSHRLCANTDAAPAELSRPLPMMWPAALCGTETGQE